VGDIAKMNENTFPRPPLLLRLFLFGWITYVFIQYYLVFLRHPF